MSSSAATKQPRAAILLCGHFRNFTQADILAKYHRLIKDCSGCTDIFIHTWTDMGLRGKETWIANSPTTPNFSEIINILKPKKILIENHAEVLSKCGFYRGNRLLHYAPGQDCEKEDFSKFIISQLYSIYEANKLKQAYEQEGNFKYDVVIKIRSDIPPFINISKILEMKLDNILVANNTVWHRHHGGGGGCLTCNKELASGQPRIHKKHTNDLCDIYFYGKSELMDIYASLFVHVGELLDKFSKENAEIGRCSCEKKLKYGTMVMHFDCYEYRYKCVYPERMVREFMEEYWIISDPGYLEN